MQASRIGGTKEGKTYTIYTATFQDGTELTYTETEGFRNRLEVYNDICTKRIGKEHGELQEITCRPMHK